MPFSLSCSRIVGLCFVVSAADFCTGGVVESCRALIAAVGTGCREDVEGSALRMDVERGRREESISPSSYVTLVSVLG